MSQEPALPHERLAAAMEARADDLGLNLADISRQAPITMETLRAIRRGKNTPTAKTMRKLERVLQWKLGSIKAIYEGGEPTPLEPRPDGEPEAEREREPTMAEMADRVAALEQMISDFIATQEPRDHSTGTTERKPD